MRAPPFLFPVVIGLFVVMGAPSPVSAQGCCSVELRGGHVWPDGRALESVRESSRLGGAVSFDLGPAVALGLGGNTSTARLSILSPRDVDFSAHLWTAFAEGRYRFTGRTASPGLVPFVGARLGYVDAELRESERSVYSNAGILAGGQVGVEGRIAPHLAVVGALDYEIVGFGDEGVTDVPEIEGWGRRFGLWGGVRVSF